MKLSKSENGWMFYCPGCRYAHVFDQRWTFDGNQDAPTFTPSLLVNGTDPKYVTEHNPRCHMYVRNGNIEFLSDCSHAMAGKTVPIPNYETLFEDEPTNGGQL